MESLPNTSEASITNGLWFVFPVEGHTIRAWGSTATGMERVYFDDTIVSERRSFGRRNMHTFKTGVDDYTVVFHTTSILKGELQCALYKDRTAVQALEAKVVKSKLVSGDSAPVALVRISLVAAAGVAAYYAGKHFGLPFWLQILMVTAAILLLKRGSKEGKYSKGGFTIVDAALPPNLE